MLIDTVERNNVVVLQTSLSHIVTMQLIEEFKTCLGLVIALF